MRKIRNPESKKKICIKIINPNGPPHTFDRIPRRDAYALMMKHDNVVYTSKSAYKRVLKNM